MRRLTRACLLTLALSAPIATTVHAQVDVPPILNPLDTTGVKQAVRLDPPPPPWPTGIYGLPIAPFGLSACGEMMYYARQFGLPAAFEGIGWRESNCRNEDGVHTSCCWGYWQLHAMHFPMPECDAWSYRDVNSNDPFEKQKQACAAKQLYDAARYLTLGGDTMNIPEDWDELVYWITNEPDEAADAIVNLQRQLAECKALLDDDQ